MKCLNDWPIGVPLAIRDGKSRSEAVGFVYNDVQAGPPISELVSKDTPTTWDLTLKLSGDEAQIFQGWLRQGNFKYNPNTTFTMPINMESGLVDQEVQFLSYPQATQTGFNRWEYNFTVLTRELSRKTSDKCLNGELYILQYKSEADSYEMASFCFGQAFDNFWPQAEG